MSVETDVLQSENGRSFEVQNLSGLPSSTILSDPSIREIANELSNWADSARATIGRSSLFDRGAYASPDNPFTQMTIASRALENDDVVAGVAEVTEGLAFQGLAWESDDADEADVFNQMAEDLDLDAVIRRLWREEFGVSQVYVATWWGRKTYTVRGRTPPELPDVHPDTGMPPLDPKTGKPVKPKKGAKRRKSYDVVCPVGLTIFDPTKIIPCGMLAFGQERLCYRASREEMETFRTLLNPPTDGSPVPSDPFMETLFTAVYKPSRGEAAELSKWGVAADRLLVCNPLYVWRHTSTKSDYQRFAPVRLKSVFRLLDLKQQMLEADRVLLIGAANYILLVKKGEKELPAQQQEIDNLNNNFRYIAKLPVIVSDHRLSIEIIAPKIDFTLNGDRYDTIDNRILRRLLGSLGGGSSSGKEGAAQASIGGRATARGMENRRHMLARTLERQIGRAVIDHPENHGTFIERPKLAYRPRNIEMDVNAAIVQAVIAARVNGELSRQTFLEELGFDEAVEAQRREDEDEMYPDIFKPIAVPFSSPALTPGLNPDDNGDGGDLPSGGNKPPPTKGGRGPGNGGGRPTGGGTSSKATTKARPQTGSGNPATGGK